MVSHPDRLARRTVFSFDFVDATDIDDVSREISSYVHSDDSVLPLVVTPNVDHLVRLEGPDAALRGPTARAAFILPDGAPVVAASKLLGEPLRGRLTGSDLFGALWGLLHDQQRPVLVIAPTIAVADGLHAEHAGALVLVAPVLDEADAEAVAAYAADVIHEAAAHRPSHVFVCLSQPKQLILSLAMIDAWPTAPVPLMLNLGAASEMHLGLVRRAPRWVQRIGMEWFYRFLQEPRRLFTRYFVDDRKFAALTVREWRAARR